MNKLFGLSFLMVVLAVPAMVCAADGNNSVEKIAPKGNGSVFVDNEKDVRKVAERHGRIMAANHKHWRSIPGYYGRSLRLFGSFEATEDGYNVYQNYKELERVTGESGVSDVLDPALWFSCGVSVRILGNDFGDYYETRNRQLSAVYDRHRANQPAVVIQKAAQKAAQKRTMVAKRNELREKQRAFAKAFICTRDVNGVPVASNKKR